MGAKVKKAMTPEAPLARSGAVTERFDHVAQRGAALGLTAAKTGRIGGRVNPELVRIAKERTGIASDSELLELALTNLVLEDGFADAFRAVRGTVDEDVELGL